MQDEMIEVLDTAIYKEVAAEALYTAAQKQTTDAGAKALMRALAEEEKKHSTWLKDLKGNGASADWHTGETNDLRISSYLTTTDKLNGTGLQDTLIFAIKREQEAMEFYAKMMGVLRGKTAKALCQKLAQEELRHKYKLEVLYDDTFYAGT
jgi:rubrerythrin